MKRKQQIAYNEILSDVAITAVTILMVLLGVADILPVNRFVLFGGGILAPRTAALHQTLSVVVGCVLLFISYRLYKRVRMAYYITVCLLPLSALLHLYDATSRWPLLPVVVIELLMEAVLLLLHRHFTRHADPITLRRGALFALLCVALVLLNTGVGLFVMRHHFHGIATVWDAVYQSLRLFVLMDISGASPKGLRGLIFLRSAVVLYWASLAAAVLFILKPLVYQPIVSARDHARVRELLRKYGYNSLSYVDVEQDKRYYFGQTIEGFIAYVIEADTAVCVGDPICREEDCAVMLLEFRQFCKQNDLSICFCQASEDWLEIYKGMGFGAAKCGEEAAFELASYNIDGPKTAKVRRDVRSAARKGITVEEYRPQLARNAALEQEIWTVSQEWLSQKKSGELSFLLGSVGLDDPLDRRYFLARDHSGQVCAFVVFLPYVDGYYADVTRHRRGTPAGVMESITLTAFDTFRREGVRWGSMGVAPLANTRTDTQSTRVATLLAYVFEHANGFYAFKSLYQYKKKYNPTLWKPHYFIYYPAKFTPQLSYALIKAQNRGGVQDFLFNRLCHLLARLFRVKHR
ncbi:bifunctional lysylphosphatidylglycerol flippase/synthetase MprF [Ethanoligenens sp.]|uniref:bifunctional lysylphosphatidylglycerol flippase/synthetase MprF n=1 Tax=Ethanoligenens sp. TaxID=2099655 RepID=UPI0039E94E16